MGPSGRHPGRNRPSPELGFTAAVATIDDVITYLEMRTRPVSPRIPAPAAKLALMRAEECTVSFYRYLYETVGTPWLWYERRLLDDTSLAAPIPEKANTIFVLFFGGRA